MTIVEFFEKSPFENMISCLTAKPEKVIFLGDSSQINKALPVYREFLKGKHLSQIVLEPRHINKHDLQNIVQTLTDIVKSEPDCIFDITGGEDLLILGCGIVFAKYGELHPFRLQRFDLESGKIIDCDCDDEISFKGVFSVTVEELISLYGGTVIPENPQPSNNANKSDVDALWDIARTNVSVWSASVGFLKEFEKRSIPMYDKTHIYLTVSQIKEEIAGYGRKYNVYTKFLRKLARVGAIYNLNINNNCISYSYKNSVVRRCLNSPGDILEMKVLFVARSLQDNGKPFFDSCHIGVNIDWDGKIQHSNDTKNEIDVILMHALTPVFISCKIGFIDEVEPYKLWTVAERFGGKKAKKMLISGNFERETETSASSFINRVKDMEITFIQNAATMTDSDWEKTLKDIVK